AVSALIEKLSDSNSRVRRSAIRALSNIGDTQAVEPLIAVALCGKSRKERELAQNMLAGFGEVAVEKIAVALHNATTSGVRQRAVAALITVLESIDNACAVDALISALIPLLRNHENTLRANATLALGKIKDVRAIEPLVAMLCDRSPNVRQCAVRALGEIGAPAVSHLLQFLSAHTSNRDICEHVIDALVEIGSPSVEPLKIALYDPDKNIRRYAAIALGRIGDPSVAETLVVLLNGTDKSKQRLAAQALREIGALNSIAAQLSTDALLTALRDPDPSVRGDTAHLLGKIANVRAIGPLIATLSYSKPSVRWEAAYALTQIGTSATEPLLEVLRNTNDENTRWYAIWILGKLGDTRATELLIDALNDPSWSIKWIAAESLGQIGDLRALPGLERLANESTGKVAIAAHEAIA
ncbi:MAG: HEAT repeat domain-containing protein, partial [Candidatus Kryptoniota bacterium]